MRHLGWIIHHRPRRIALLAGIVLLPILALGLLAFRTLQTEQIREGYQRRERQQQILRLLESDLSNWIMSQSAKVEESVLEFEIQENRVFLPHLNVYISTDYDRLAGPQLSDRDMKLWHNAQATEFRSAKPTEAIQSYRRLISSDTVISSWAKLALLRLTLKHAAASDAALWLKEIEDTDQASLTESGIPIQVAAALLLSEHDKEETFPETDEFLNRTLSQLASGCWLLNAAQWSYYASEICSSTISSGDSCFEALESARLLESFAEIVNEVLALNQSLEWRTEQPFAAHLLPGIQSVLILFREKYQNPGLILSIADLTREADTRLSNLTAAEDFECRIGLSGNNQSAAAVSLSSFPFMEASFSERKQVFWRSHLRKYSIFYAITLLLFGAGAGLFFTYRAVAREMEVSRMKEEFVSSVSHEFRTPLSAIEALLERLESGKVRDEEMLHRYYQTSRREVQRLATMVNNLLDFSRLREGRQKFSFETIDLNQVADEVLQSFRNLGFLPRLEDALCREEPLNISADKNAAYQCIYNLIDNALKYSPDGSKVTIGSGRQNGEVFLKVSDRGSGIAPEERERIFEQFYRAKNNDTHRIQGVGMGLALVKKFMQEHGGKLTLESRVGEGSTFQLTFPEVKS